jgi:hypothetical protein
MSQVINGNELKNGNFLVEFTASQMDDLRTIYLLKSLDWEDKGKEKKTLDEMDTCNRIAQRYYESYIAIRTIQGKEF